MARDVHSVMSHEDRDQEEKGPAVSNLKGVACCNSLKDLGDGSIPGPHM